MSEKKSKSSLPPTAGSAPSSKEPRKARKPTKAQLKKTSEIIHKKSLPFPPRPRHPRHSRLYTRAIFIGYKRSQRNQYERYARLRIEGVTKKSETNFYLGKSVAFVYKGHKKNPSGKGANEVRRIIWGKIVKSHGAGGVVLSKFATNLPSNAIASQLRVFMYPSRI